ncbi:hypothetical protein [Flavonifractor sp. An92]|nr:hypothetical protein [Flavonifractor sp. An92]
MSTGGGLAARPERLYRRTRYGVSCAYLHANRSPSSDAIAFSI